MKWIHPILSERPEDLKDAIEWGRLEKERMDKSERDGKLLCEELKPFVEKIIEAQKIKKVV